jgi:flagellar basal-body rod modification protein FlgD
MAAATGIWTQVPAIGQQHSGAHPTPMTGPASTDNGNDDSSDSSAGGATISANDFLTLLVTEMQNQDPTDDTDPNEYIDQLVEVNSLEQLIDINQNLSTALGISSTDATDDAANPQAVGATASTTPSGAGGIASLVQSATRGAGSPGVARSLAPSAAQIPAAHGRAGQALAPGNLGVPGANPAARRVAESLGGGPRAQ